jgi:hypothetical protein
MEDAPAPIACRLDLLSPAERRREQELLGLARQRLGEARETPGGYRFAVPPDWLGEVGELLGLERRCCPFLAFSLEIAAEQGEVTLHIHGGPGVKAFVAQTFGRPAS